MKRKPPKQLWAVIALWGTTCAVGNTRREAIAIFMDRAHGTTEWKDFQKAGWRCVKYVRE